MEILKSAFFYALPLFIGLIKKFKFNYHKALFICFLSFFMNLLPVDYSLNSLSERYVLIENIENYSEKVNNQRILIDSNTYSLVRKIRRNGVIIDDYYTSILENDIFDFDGLNMNEYNMVVIANNNPFGLKFDNNFKLLIREKIIRKIIYF